MLDLTIMFSFLQVVINSTVPMLVCFSVIKSCKLYFIESSYRIVFKFDKFTYLCKSNDDMINITGITVVKAGSFPPRGTPQRLVISI